MFFKKSNTESRKSRRVFLKSTGALAAALSAARPSPSRAARETLALNGGPKAVTVPYNDASRWPRYGEAEEKAVLDLVRNPVYGPIDALENDWRDYFGVDHAKAHANGTSALSGANRSVCAGI